MGSRMKTIFVVDDEEITLKTAEFILQQDGYDVVKCLSGMACLESLKEVLPDLILLDVEMPEMNGFETLAKIKEKHDIPVIFTTGNKDIDTIKKSTDLGVVDYISKPFTALALKEIIHSMLNE